MTERRVALYRIILTDTTEKKPKVVYNENLPFSVDENSPTACNEENIRGVMRLFQFDKDFDKIEFTYYRDLLDIER